MKKIVLFTLLSTLPCFLFAHGNDDPLKDLQKNRSSISTKQDSFKDLKSTAERYQSLQAQTDYLQRNILILRNLMAKDYPHINEGMSKYKLDYIEEVDDSLKEFKETIQLMKDSMPD
jgi:hypothetical protein